MSDKTGSFYRFKGENINDTLWSNYTIHRSLSCPILIIRLVDTIRISQLHIWQWFVNKREHDNVCG
jgi:hypothetical protein